MIFDVVNIKLEIQTFFPQVIHRIVINKLN